jgi:hypothetical protein
VTVWRPAVQSIPTLYSYFNPTLWYCYTLCKLFVMNNLFSGYIYFRGQFFLCINHCVLFNVWVCPPQCIYSISVTKAQSGFCYNSVHLVSSLFKQKICCLALIHRFTIHNQHILKFFLLAGSGQ